jgi:PAS domain S-box-containing protein
MSRPLEKKSILTKSVDISKLSQGEIQNLVKELMTYQVELRTRVEEYQKVEEFFIRKTATGEAINRILRQYLSTASREELGQFCLHIVEELTQSQYGFIGEVREDGLLHDVVWSNPGWEACKMSDKAGHRRPVNEFKIIGLHGWVLNVGQTLLSNEPRIHIASIGTPKGHPPIKAFLGVPLFSAGKIFGILALANRPGGYRDEDREAAEALAPAITEALMHKQAEDALRESEERYRAFFENSLDAVLITSPDGSIQAANSEACRMFDMNEQELSQAGRDGVVDKSDPRLIPALEERTRTGKFKGELRYKRKDGTTFPCEVSNAYFTDRNGKTLVAQINRDITKSKQAEETLQESENKLRSVLDSSRDIIYRVNLRTNCYEYISPAVQEVLGYSPLECTAMDIQTTMGLVHPDSVAIVTNGLDQARRIGKFEMNYSIRRKDGKYIWVHNRISIIYDLEGKPLFQDGIIHDVTEQRKAKEALDKAKDDLEIKVKERTKQLRDAINEITRSQKSLKEANNQLKQYAAKITNVQEEERKRIAYELHDDTAQYLSILKMQIEAMAESGEVRSPKIKERLRFLEKDAERAFNDVRRYSHELRPVVLEHYGLVTALEQLAEDYNKLGPLSVNVNVEDAEPDLSEEIKLGFFRIAQEALNNSRKHAKARLVNIDLKFSLKQIKMTVSDNGEGFNIRNTLKRSGGKGNLGLISMRERANLIDADLKIESEPGKGTKVTLKTKLNS